MLSDRAVGQSLIFEIRDGQNVAGIKEGSQVGHSFCTVRLSEESQLEIRIRHFVDCRRTCELMRGTILETTLRFC